MDDFTKKNKYESLHSAIKDVVGQNNDLYQKALEEKYGIKQEEVSEDVEQLDEASSVSFATDIVKVGRDAPVKGVKTLRNNIMKALDQKFKSKLGNYELKTDKRTGSNIVDVEITTDKKLSKKDKTDIENHLTDKGLNRF